MSSSSTTASVSATVPASASSSSSICDKSITNLFPLKSISDVVNLFRIHLESAKEPDLTLLSIVTGIIENTLTIKCANITSTASDIVDQNSANNNEIPKKDLNDVAGTTSILNSFPVIELKTVEDLYEKFTRILSTIGECKQRGGGGDVNNKSDKKTLLNNNKTRSTSTPSPTLNNKSAKNNSQNKSIYATRELIKRVSDVIWNSLIRTTYKDRAHLQSMYSYLAHSKLDCFGAALAVVAGCQQLGYNDVHLAISEDHAWVVFGKTGEETIEVTWHGKGAEDKRGQSVTPSYEAHSWLYLSGNPVICDRYIEIASIVSSINPSLNMTSLCSEVAELQQRLLWLLYDMKHLDRYPMGLGCLGELEEVSATKGRPTAVDLYTTAVASARRNYKNHHVYPYTYEGGYYYRKEKYKEALAAWANAGDVIRLYNYSRDDEEIYKEFLDIANELIPHVMKAESSGHSAKSVLRDPFCFGNLLRFYDGICQWEEGSLTPILHIGWVKPLVTTISRFDAEVRCQLIIHCSSDYLTLNGFTSLKSESNNNIVEDDKKTLIAEESNTAENVRTNLVEALTAACGEKILNPDFLLQGGGQPFADQQNNQNTEETTDANKESGDLLLLKQQQKLHESETKPSPVINEILLKNTKSESDEDEKPLIVRKSVSPVVTEPIVTEPMLPEITLYSHKMKGLRDILLAEKLNTHAISLQLTAQSQVQVGGKKSRHSAGPVNYSTTTKRTRRE